MCASLDSPIPLPSHLQWQAGFQRVRISIHMSSVLQTPSQKFAGHSLTRNPQQSSNVASSQG
jgi:hypothetical protein